MPGKFSYTVSSLATPSFVPARLPWEGSMSQITDLGGGGAGCENTGTFFSSPDIFSDPVHRAAPHTASQQPHRGAATTLRNCRQWLKGHPTFSLRLKLIQGKNPTHLQNVELVSSSSSCWSVTGYAVRKGCAGRRASASSWGDGGTIAALSSGLQLQQVRCNTKVTNLGPI